MDVLPEVVSAARRPGSPRRPRRGATANIPRLGTAAASASAAVSRPSRDVVNWVRNKFGRRQAWYAGGMTLAIIVAVCVILLLLAFLLPRLSRRPQRGVDRTLAAGQRRGGRAPGPIGRLFSKSFGASRKATNKSAATGRRARHKLPH